MEKPLTDLTDAHAAALTAYGEARSERVTGIIAVLSVIRNRSMEKARNRTAICLQPWQFSCWNETDPNRAELLMLASYFLNEELTPYNPVLDVCVMLAAREDLKDVTRGATHYFNPNIVRTPTWAYAPAEPTTVIGSHKFFRKVKW